MQALARWRDLSRLLWRDVRYGALNHHEKEKLSKALPHAAEASLLETLRTPLRRPLRDVKHDEALLRGAPAETEQYEDQHSPTPRAVEARYLKRHEAIEAEFNAKVAVRRARLEAQLDELNSKKAPVLKSLEARLESMGKTGLFTPPPRLEVPVIELSAEDHYWRRQERIEKLSTTPFPFPSPAELATRQPSLRKSWWSSAKEMAAYRVTPPPDFRFEEWRRVVWAPVKARLEELDKRDSTRLGHWLPPEKLKWNEMANFRRRIAEAQLWGEAYVDDKGDVAASSDGTEEEVRSDGSMTLHDAIQILGLSSRPSKESLIEKRDTMEALNDPEKGGSAFLRDKVHVAADVVLNAIERNLPFPALSDDANEAESSRPAGKTKADKGSKKDDAEERVDA